MGEERFYDPEDVARSWTELHVALNAGYKNDPHLLEYLELLQAVRWMMPRLMAYMSEDIWCAGWLENLHEVLSKQFPAIDVAAKHLGSVCTYWDGNDDNEGEWREY